MLRKVRLVSRDEAPAPASESLPRTRSFFWVQCYFPGASLPDSPIPPCSPSLAPTVFQQRCHGAHTCSGVSFLPQKGLMNSPYLLAEVLETVELFTALYAVTCLDTKATTEPSGTYRGEAGKGLGAEALPPSQDEHRPWGQSGPH